MTYNYAKGTLARLYVNAEVCYIELNGAVQAGALPKDHYFILSKNHGNYEAVYSLLLTALANGLVVEIRATTDINPNNNATFGNAASHPPEAANGIVLYVVAWSR
jgi:transketolase N-terminal domain/subunit